ncbi:MAG: hypothetical protein IPL78_03690 [Chloroflexi bacterium]|nr:hypothetical protein [Chloroflexota bacterium]
MRGVAGTNRRFNIPAGVLPSQDFYDLFARFRLRPDSGIQGNCSDDTAIALTGLIVGGEVEDHRASARGLGLPQ